MIRRIKKLDMCKVLLTIAVVVIIIFMLAPLVIVMATSVNPTRIVFPPEGITFKWFTAILYHREFVNAAKVSVFVAMSAAIGSTSMGCMVCIACRYFKVPGKHLIYSIFSAPILIPAVIIGLSLYQIVLMLIGAKSLMTLIIGHIVITMPFPIRIINSMMEVVEPEMEEAAMSVGADRWTTFLKVTLPIIRPGVVCGALYSAIISWNNFPVSMFLCSLGYITLPIRIYNYLEYQYEPLIAAMGAMIVVISGIIVWTIDKYMGLSLIYGKNVV